MSPMIVPINTLSKIDRVTIMIGSIVFMITPLYIYSTSDVAANLLLSVKYIGLFRVSAVDASILINISSDA